MKCKCCLTVSKHIWVYFFLQSNISHMQHCNDCFNHSLSANPLGPYIYMGIKWDQLRWLCSVDFKLNFKYICAVFGGVLLFLHNFRTFLLLKSFDFKTMCTWKSPHHPLFFGSLKKTDIWKQSCWDANWIS